MSKTRRQKSRAPGSRDLLKRHTDQHIEAIELCLKHGHRMPALILIYTGIDFMASLNRPENEPDVRRQDFLDWVEKYFLPNGSVTCSSLDLYAARCALVHTYTPISGLSRQKKAKEILYAWGKADSKSAQDLLNHVGMVTRVFVHIDDLFSAFRAGVEQFLRRYSPLRSQRHIGEATGRHNLSRSGLCHSTLELDEDTRQSVLRKISPRARSGVERPR